MTARARLAAVALAAALAAPLGACSHLVVLHDALSPSEHTDLGVAYERTAQPRLAAAEYRRALRLDRRQVRARVNLGNLAGARGDWRGAEREYRRAVRLAPADADALNNLAYALVRRGRRLDEAERLAARAAASGGARDSIYRATLDEVRAARAK